MQSDCIHIIKFPNEKQIFLLRLKEKGILGELQAFLRMKMVEKLQGSELGATQHTQFSAKDDAINTMVYDYLKQHHMYYTLSVFASECSSIQQQSISNLDVCGWKDVLNSLGIHNIDNAIPSKSDEANKCLLNFLVNAFGNSSGKKNESKSCQCDLESNPKKLMLNTQSQTDVSVRNANTLGVQTLPPNLCHTETQTADLLLSTIKRSSDELNSEIAELQNKLEQSQSALNLCQMKLLDSEKKIECLITHKKGRNLTTILPSSNIGTHPSTTTYNTRNRITCQKRIQEASRFLSHLDGRLQFLDQKYQNVAAVGSLTNDNQHLRYLPDSNVSSLAYS